MKPEKLAELIAEAARDKKARDVVIIDLAGKTTIADFFVIGEGDTDRQIRAIVENIEEKCREVSIRPLHVAGLKDATWACADFNDVIVHIFLPGERSFYDLEGLWGHEHEANAVGE